MDFALYFFKKETGMSITILTILVFVLTTIIALLCGTTFGAAIALSYIVCFGLLAICLVVYLWSLAFRGFTSVINRRYQEWKEENEK